MFYLSLPDFAVPLLQRRRFDLQTHLQQEAHSQEKANGVEMLREQEEFEWGSISLNVWWRGEKNKEVVFFHLSDCGRDGSIFSSYYSKCISGFLLILEEWVD